MVDIKLQKILDAIKVIKEYTVGTVSRHKIITGTVVQYDFDKKSNVFSIVLNTSADKRYTAFVDVRVDGNNISFKENTFVCDIINDIDSRKEVEIISSDVTAWVNSILNSNPKKEILEKQISELEAKLNEIKTEVKTM